MFKIGSQRLAWVPVKWTGLADDGSQVQNEIQLQVHLVDRSALQRQIERERADDTDAASTAQFALDVARDWKGVGNVDGEPLGFTRDNFAMLLEAPGFAFAFGRAYLQAWSGQGTIRQGNLEASPAGGGTETPPPAKATPAG